jgi:carbon-monoxide dehydrogenase large subunit
MFDSAEIRVHPTGSAILRLGVQSQGQGHETTFAQIVAEELGIPASKVKVEEGDTDTAPYGLGTYASRSTPTAGAATAIAARKIREKTRHLAAHLLECSPDDLEWTPGQWSVKGSPDRFKTIAELAFAAYTNHPAGMEAGLEATDYYDPPNLTFPFGSYICVVDIDKGTGQVNVRRFVAIDDCGNIINPMIVDGQIHGGLTMGPRPGAVRGDLVRRAGQTTSPGRSWTTSCPTAVETPAWETGKTITPSPHHPLGAKGVGESATVGAPPAIANAVVDALAHLGVTNIDIPITPQKVWAILHEKASPSDGRPEPGAADRGPRGGREPVRGRHGRGGPAADVRQARRARDHPPGRHDRGLGRRQLRPARRRPGGAPRRSSTGSPACCGCRRRDRPRDGARTASSSWS